MQGIFSKFFMTAGVAATITAGAIAPRPAAASTQDTIETILGAAALVGGIVMYDNYESQQADAVCGYTANGGTVLCNGEIVMPDGTIFYPGQYDGGPWIWDNGWRPRAGDHPAVVYRDAPRDYRAPAPARPEYRAPAPAQYRAPAPAARNDYRAAAPAPSAYRQPAPAARYAAAPQRPETRRAPQRAERPAPQRGDDRRGH